MFEWTVNSNSSGQTLVLPRIFRVLHSLRQRHEPTSTKRFAQNVNQQLDQKYEIV